MATHDKEIRNGLLTLLKGKTWTDYEIVCEGEAIPVHRVILCSASRVFKAACSAEFKEANGTYQIDDYPLWAVRSMVDYIYSGTYDEKKYSQGDDGKKSELHITMFALGDRYIIPGLKKYACERYRSMLIRRVLSPADFILSVANVYKTTPHTVRDLRNAAVCYAVRRYRKVLLSSEIKPLYNSLISDCPDFASDLLAEFMSEERDGDYHYGPMKLQDCEDFEDFEDFAIGNWA
ncbi:hypothetical protein E4U42_003146 [Claviceps africana]|uniref:BTB domain-containing protein n=1 Tax=Claviceps africana TaxID=83212 RepID=A0A8K0J7C0_9HYPO|nr:hypothetical protein E4U42_003146 [Claviceps africana]